MWTVNWPAWGTEPNPERELSITGRLTNVRHLTLESDIVGKILTSKSTYMYVVAIQEGFGISCPCNPWQTIMSRLSFDITMLCKYNCGSSLAILPISTHEYSIGVSDHGISKCRKRKWVKAVHLVACSLGSQPALTPACISWVKILLFFSSPNVKRQFGWTFFSCCTSYGSWT